MLAGGRLPLRGGASLLSHATHSLEVTKSGLPWAELGMVLGAAKPVTALVVPLVVVGIQMRPLFSPLIRSEASRGFLTNETGSLIFAERFCEPSSVISESAR